MYYAIAVLDLQNKLNEVDLQFAITVKNHTMIEYHTKKIDEIEKAIKKLSVQGKQ